MKKFPFLSNTNEWISFFKEMKKIHFSKEAPGCDEVNVLRRISSCIVSEIEEVYEKNGSFKVSEEILLWISSNLCGNGESHFDQIIMKKLIEVTK